MISLAQWQRGRVSKRACRRSGVRPLPPAYYFSHNFFADPVVPFQTRSPYTSKTYTLDHPLIRSNIQQAKNMVDPPKMIPIGSCAVIGPAILGLTQIQFHTPKLLLISGPF